LGGACRNLGGGRRGSDADHGTQSSVRLAGHWDERCGSNGDRLSAVGHPRGGSLRRYPGRPG
jgi:hypothetical protein